MSQVFSSKDSRSALVFVRESSGGMGHLGRHPTGASRGTSAYLGNKGRNLALYAKRIGTPLKVRPKSRTPIKAHSSPELPRLYHGLPSSGDETEALPIESTRAIHTIERELSALEGRIQRQAPGASAPPCAVAPAAEVGSSIRSEPAASHSGVPRSSPGPSEPFCTPSSRWDEFGRDVKAIESFSPIGTFLTKRYFRATVTGLENLPVHGPCLLVANHSGSLPIDGLVLASALSSASPGARPIRWLTEDFVQNLPFLGTRLQRLGAVRASRENVLRLLLSGECVVAFPEGFKGYAKPASQFYRVQRLGRGRIAALCLEARVPLLPCAVVGGEEASPSLRRLEAMERWLGMPYFPITPTFPWLGPLGLLPAPSRWYIDVGPPFLTGAEAANADDPLYLAELTNRLRTTLQERVDQLLARRQSIWR